ncbi:MAG: carboxynorspermidine decarboxylase [Bacteroidetes bacterium GWF2_42_66]|nr:MAG: carboxynorspermidine decarboxylase [Bacteroidetes bacterium GWA2_42_15]OFY02512.1 MAG: carboxynorspermidine decarboxylase [Bacteroidetes bacterium GWE2_42_39]OFY41390.1 MAG: carboxynorspermidine decarboxylase [Bacteroidetes bacterium GWF2_42_66]HBL75406.1 carboxynorspermidine decarboxylase [Prolixibacteraceae bacterium]HCR90981.1 carboxynorspermidine decarboxylase [Prolixibacteraceae bacterium]
MEQFGRINLTHEQLAGLETPCYIVNETKLEENLKILHKVQEQAGCKILLAFKGFAMWSMAPLVRKYLPGVAASSVFEAELGRREFGGEVHVYAPAFSQADIDAHIQMADHIVFNSVNQWVKYRNQIKQHPHIQCAVRLNPEHREATTEIYDPSAPNSRLGITLKNFTENLDKLEGLSGLHFHNLCELNCDALERTLEVVEDKFGFYFNKIKWINFGGGHHISRPDYDVDRLITLIKNFKAKYGLDVYLEPGEAIALNTGVLVSRVLDTFNNGKDIAILDTSATAHMPDVLEMPYRPYILNADEPGIKPYTIRLGGLTCLAGDVIGDYSFDQPLREGDFLVFGDMAHYTMVKNTMFNGVRLPAISIFNSEKNEIRLVRKFGYEDYKDRLS